MQLDAQGEEVMLVFAASSQAHEIVKRLQRRARSLRDLPTNRMAETLRVLTRLCAKHAGRARDAWLKAQNGGEQNIQEHMQRAEGQVKMELQSELSRASAKENG